MFRSARWPILVVCLVGGVAVGRWAGQPSAQGQLAPAAPPIPRELTSYRDVVRQVLPAVVSIESKAKPRRQEANQPRRRPRPQAPDNFPGVPEEFHRFFEDMERRQEQSPQQDLNLGF